MLSSPSLGTAKALVTSRLRASALNDFPGALPATLDDAYAIQVEAIALWPDSIVGWKVGRLSAECEERFGVDRFVGPIFSNAVCKARDDILNPFAIYGAGSAAFEAEYVVFAGADETGRIVPARMATGIEIASSPIHTLPGLGSLALIADLGNNAGLILGPEVPLGKLATPHELTCSTRIGDAASIAKTADILPGGPATAFAFAVTQTSHIGFPMRPGQFVSTGAVTGMHAVTLGDRCIADFGAFGRIECRVTERDYIPLSAGAQQ